MRSLLILTALISVLYLYHQDPGHGNWRAEKFFAISLDRCPDEQPLPDNAQLELFTEPANTEPSAIEVLEKLYTEKGQNPVASVNQPAKPRHCSKSDRAKIKSLTSS